VLQSDPPDGMVLKKGPSQLVVVFNKDVVHDGSNDAANNPLNYLLVEQGRNTLIESGSCATGRMGDDTRWNISSVTYDNNGGAGPFKAVLNLAAGLPNGTYRLFVCGTTSIRDFFGSKINDGRDTVVNFRVTSEKAKKLPVTGFAPGKITDPGPQPFSKAYSAADMFLKIPSLGLSMPIVGVPFEDGGWDVSWLGSNAGWLENTAFPSWVGNSVITGHVWNANNTQGVFLNLKNLKYGDQVNVIFGNQISTYEVRENLLIQPGQSDQVLRHEDSSWLTLLTCEDFNPLSGSYTARRIVRAVLVKIYIK
jgi:LPXTG-site transpeptidase (sortase) family protein